MLIKSISHSQCNAIMPTPTKVKSRTISSDGDANGDGAVSSQGNARKTDVVAIESNTEMHGEQDRDGASPLPRSRSKPYDEELEILSSDPEDVPLIVLKQIKKQDGELKKTYDDDETNQETQEENILEVDHESETGSRNAAKASRKKSKTNRSKKREASLVNYCDSGSDSDDPVATFVCEGSDSYDNSLPTKKKSKHDETWERRCLDLIAFQEKHGHCRAPQNSQVSKLRRLEGQSQITFARQCV